MNYRFAIRNHFTSNVLNRPSCDLLDPDYYTPAAFYIEVIITVFQQSFIITGADLHVYRYMQTYPKKLLCEIIENIPSYMVNWSLLNKDTDDRVEEDMGREEKDHVQSVKK